MSLPPADRNILFALIALQMDFITRDQLLDAVHAWMQHETTPLGAILRERSILSERRASLLEQMVEEHVAQHGGEARASLAALRVEEEVWKDLEEIEDRQMHTSPATLAPAQRDAAGETTQPGLSADSGFLRNSPIPPLPGAPMGNRFRRLREHARGGLGEVYVALDEELKREVALKQIQDRFADHFEARCRFLREAEITGKLEHPGVVPVYGLGSYPDGRPYYAMRFIRGESMDRAIARFHEADDDPRRDPGERSLALRDLLTRFIAVCNVVAYAHSRGVIHRDLKPANAMLGEYGETLVVDWGLARMLDSPEEDHTIGERPVLPGSGIRRSATVMGQAVGTPAFMPPEQAHGRLERVSVASDVFSLGGTLYAVLTGQPPYQGEDLLEQACGARVVPARQRKRSVPAALEAVCARAMEKRPEDRYESARAVAEEVQRWLADEPVQAYREPPSERLRRWGRRHRSVVVTAVVLLAAGVVGLGIGLWAVGREQERTKAALARTQTAEAEAKASAEQAARAEANTLADYRASTDDAIEQLIGSRPVLGPQEKYYLEKTLERWQALAARTGDDERSRAIRAEGQFRVAFLRHKLGQTEEAIAGYREALAIQQRLADDFPDVPRHRKGLALAHTALGILLADRKQHEKSAEHYRKALALQQQLADELPDVPDYRKDLAGTHVNLGLLLTGPKQWENSVLHYHEALALLQKLANENPAVHEYRKGLAHTHHLLGVLWTERKEQKKAAEHYGEALTLRKKLADDYPGRIEYRRDLAGTHNSLGVLLGGQKQWEKAAQHYHEALAILRKLTDDFPAVPAYRQELAGTHANLGILSRKQNQGKKASEHYQKALSLGKKLADEYPAVPTYRSELAGIHFNLANLLAGLNQQEKSSEHYHEALELLQKLAGEFPGVADYRQSLVATHNNLGKLLARHAHQEKAMAQYQKSLEIQQELARDFPAVTAYQVDLGRDSCNHGNRLLLSGKTAASLPWYDRAIHTLTRLDQQGPESERIREWLCTSHAARAFAYGQLGKPSEALPDWKRAIALGSPRRQPSLRIARASSRVRAGQVAEGVAEVEELTSTGNLTAVEFYGCATIYAVASRKSADRKQDYADRAMRMLRRAVQAGYTDVAHLKKNTDLDVLREREDFKRLIQGLAKGKE
jgi:serine/threonine-protein kinase